MAIAQPQFDLPSFGTIEGENLYYFSSSQRAGKTGSQKPVSVLRTPLDSSEDLVQPEMQHYLEQQAKKRKQQAEKDGN